jgi:hypothetical protein
MASSLTIYNLARQYLIDGTIDVDTDTIKLALVRSTYTPAVTTDNEWADVSGDEVASGDGYTTGGATLAGASLNESAGTVTFDATDVTWSSLTKTFRYGVLYKSGTANGITNPLIAYILFDTTPADVSVSGVDFLVQWHGDGIFTLS